MRIGLVTRAEQRGISIQSWAFARWMKPDRILVIDVGELARGFAPDFKRFPGATVVHYDGALPEQTVRMWLDGLDVVFFVETPMDWRLCQWATEAGVATIAHGNPEFCAPDGRPTPTAWWNPTPWRQSYMPEGCRVVPVPVDDDWHPFAIPEPTDTLRVLHVAGHHAMADRNGTGLVIESLRRLHGPISVRIVTQDDKLRIPRLRSSVAVEVVTGGVEDHWDLYADADVIVQPRRYGGLHLPAGEAMASGLALVMSDAEPQRSIWPTLTVRSATGIPRLQCPGGRLALTNARPEAIAQTLSTLALDRELLRSWQERSLEWAEANRWSVLRSLYEQELAMVVEGLRVPQ